MKHLYFILSALLPAKVLLAQSTDSGLSGSDLNPLAHTDLIQFVVDLLDVVIRIGIVLLVFMFIWTGFQYVSAGGNSGKIEKAHKSLMYGIIGAALVLGAFVILNVVQGTVNSIRQ